MTWLDTMEALGAGMVLTAFVFTVLGWFADDTGPWRALLNVAGGALLAACAWEHGRWGFFAMNATWSFAASTTLIKWETRRWRKRKK